MNCILCGCDISEVSKQFGDVRRPMCQSDYLAGSSWVYDEPVIVDALVRGWSFEEAQKICIDEEITDLQKFAETFHGDIVRAAQYHEVMAEIKK